MNNSKTEKAILVGAIHGKLTEESVLEHLDELELLAETAGAETIGKITQRINRINPAFYIGRGKAEEIVSQAEELDAQLIIFDEELSPAQIKNYQKITENIKIIDRSALILDIFRHHAKTKEAKTQVELAHLQYLLPRLTRLWTHLERQMGGVGTRAGAGETQIEVDRRIIRVRIGKLQKELKRIEKERNTQSKGRSDSFRVALVGYTNAGKSTLMHALSGSEVYIEDQLFATLDTTIRSVALDEHNSMLLSDTVGFIRKLPHSLVASFRSTLKEVLEADLILTVLDASSPQIQDHNKTIESVLEEIGAVDKESLVILNKVDLVENNDHIQRLRNEFPDGILISAKSHLRIDSLISAIKDVMNREFETESFFFTFQQGKEMAEAQAGVLVIDREALPEGMRMTIKASKKRIQQIRNSIKNSY